MPPPQLRPLDMERFAMPPPPFPRKLQIPQRPHTMVELACRYTANMGAGGEYRICLVPYQKPQGRAADSWIVHYKASALYTNGTRFKCPNAWTSRSSKSSVLQTSKRASITKMNTSSSSPAEPMELPSNSKSEPPRSWNNTLSTIRRIVKWKTSLLIPGPWSRWSIRWRRRCSGCLWRGFWIRIASSVVRGSMRLCTATWKGRRGGAWIRVCLIHRWLHLRLLLGSDIGTSW